MSEEDLRIQQIKMKIKGLTFEQARDISNICSEYYIEGLEQSRFDKRMLELELMGLKEDKDKLQQENKKYKQIIDKAKDLAKKQLLSNSNYTNYSDEMCLKDILDILKEVE